MTTSKAMKKITKLIISLIVSHAAGIIGSIATFNAVNTWYLTIQKPVFTPPGWLFGPAWLTLYTLMGIALYLVWDRGIREQRVRTAISLFAVQLVLNTLWSILFFGFQAPLYAFVEIMFLWLFILLTMVQFFQISKAAGWLLVPYILWVSFAAILNLSIVLLN